MSNKKSRRHIYKKHVHSKLLFQLVIFIIISLIMFGIVGYDILEQVLSLPIAAIGIVIGLVAGYLVGKFYQVKWHEDSQKIVTKMDRFGVFVIVLYVGFSLFRRQLFGQFIQGAGLTAISFASVGGVMTGRLLAITGNINKILKEQKIL